MKTIRDILITIGVAALVAILVVFSFRIGQRHPAEPSRIISDTTYIYKEKIIEIAKPVYQDRIILDTVYLALTIFDTLRVQVPVEIEQKHYADTMYDAWVSGYQPSLDSLHIYQRTEIRQITKVQPVVFGLQAGVTASKDGVQPYLGIGATLNLQYLFRR